MRSTVEQLLSSSPRQTKTRKHQGSRQQGPHNKHRHHHPTRTDHPDTAAAPRPQPTHPSQKHTYLPQKNHLHHPHPACPQTTAPHLHHRPAHLPALSPTFLPSPARTAPQNQEYHDYNSKKQQDHTSADPPPHPTLYHAYYYLATCYWPLLTREATLFSRFSECPTYLPT